MVQNCKTQIDILFEDLRKQYNNMLTYQLDGGTRGILDSTYFD